MTAKIYNLADEREKRGRWCSALVRCRCCSYVWGASYPEGADVVHLECPVCHTQDSERIPPQE